MALKKSALYSSLWRSCDELRGGMDASQYKDYILMVDRLTKLVAIFEGLDFGSNRAEGDDLLGDAYEYLMRHFAIESGKSKGQFYTPAEVSRIMSMVIDLGRATSGA
jgi:type I restriction-modification system DNA methylase subunit